MSSSLEAAGALITAVVTAVLGYFYAKRVGLGPVQEEYTKTLRDLNDGLDSKIKTIEDQLTRERAVVVSLTERVAKLERIIVDLTQENHDLHEENDGLRHRLRRMGQEAPPRRNYASRIVKEDLGPQP